MILVPSMVTEFFGVKRHKQKELLVIKLSIEDVMNDVAYDSNDVLNNLYQMISENSERKTI
jgi:hypothetical protein